MASVASVSVGFARKFRCFSRAKIKARPKHRNLRANPKETLATQATQVTDRVFPHFSVKENDKTCKFIKHVSVCHLQLINVQSVRS